MTDMPGMEPGHRVYADENTEVTFDEWGWTVIRLSPDATRALADELGRWTEGGGWAQGLLAGLNHAVGAWEEELDRRRHFH